MKTIVITGASGFIGKYLVSELLRLGVFRIKLLSRNKQRDLRNFANTAVEVMEGDLCERESLQDLLDRGCTVINLVYLQGADEHKNIAAINNLLAACKFANVKRLIHCSTAAVVGRVPDSLVTEDTPSRPVTEYGVTKLKIEDAVIVAAESQFQSVILRPTAVFGASGEPLKKLAESLTTKSQLRNYLKSCLFGTRRMNLVCVENVVAAIIFLINRHEDFSGEKFIISDDDSPANNFIDVEQFLMNAFNVPDYRFPRLLFPLGFLKLLLACLGRNNINPNCNYSSDKLQRIGFERPITFETGLARYAEWYKATKMRKHH